MRCWQNIFRLGLKELQSLRRDTVLLVLVIYAFSLAIYSRATGTSSELNNASIAVVDEDKSVLSQRLLNAFFPPSFQPPEAISPAAMDEAMDSGRYTFVLDIPPNFERDVLRGKQPALQVNIDATAMMQAGSGARYIQNIVSGEVLEFLQHHRQPFPVEVGLVTRIRFNPNLQSAWFVGIMELINTITMLSMILAGGALIREREHGTIDHLLVMPLRPSEIMLAKVWANGAVILASTALSLYLVIKLLLQVPIAGSVSLFLFGTGVYLFSGMALGILLATLARSMPQFGLLYFMIGLPMNILSGGNTPLDSMPGFLRIVMQCFPSTHYVSFAQAILYRGAGLDIVWPQFAVIAAIGTLLFSVALLRFRSTMIQAQT